MSMFDFWSDWPKATVRQTAASGAPNGIKVTLGREDGPKLQRVYTARLPRGCRLQVKRWTGYGGRYDVSNITQANGRWVLFDVERPADKILDRELLPDVERLCAEILRLDREFIASDPREFTDQQGHTWRRV